MKGIKTVVANLANRINQPHHLEIELRKVFNAGVKSAQNKNTSLSDDKIDNIIDKLDDYARNYNHYEYGLPTQNLEEMRVLIRELLK